jgi:hypothetical protein
MVVAIDALEKRGFEVGKNAIVVVEVNKTG